jgi:RimJ/RimL family protein N-acetyltransferase
MDGDRDGGKAMGDFDSVETSRLLLRRWRDSDREPFAELNADPQTLLYFPQTFGRQHSDTMIDQAEADFDRLGFGRWALQRKDTGEFIGFTGLAVLPGDIPQAGGGVEVGWRLAKHAWRHGYATEAALAAVRVGFDGVGLAEIWSTTAVLNEPSQAVMRRIGMTEVARFEHPRISDGHPLKPHVTYHLARP